MIHPSPTNSQPTRHADVNVYEERWAIIIVDTDNTDRAGIALCELSVTLELGWVFREQPTSDFGVDAHIEIRHDGVATGRLLGVQVKTGSSWFSEPYDDGWIFRPKPRHISYWLEHSLPMNLLLVDLISKTVYWQELSERTFESGPRGGILVRVPKTQVLASAREPWELAVDKLAATAKADYADNLECLSPATAREIRKLAEKHAEAATLLAAHLARDAPRPN